MDLLIHIQIVQFETHHASWRLMLTPFCAECAGCENGKENNVFDICSMPCSLCGIRDEFK